MVEGGGWHDDVNRSHTCSVGRVGWARRRKRCDGNRDYKELHLMISMVCATFGIVISSNIAGAITPLLLFLLFLCAIFIWDRRARSRRKAYVLICIVTEPAGLTTRPSLMDPEIETIARKIDDIIESVGLGPMKVMLFQGKPTTDLIVETTEPEATVSRVRTLLAGLPVTISTAGRPGDLRWHTKLWRHL